MPSANNDPLDSFNDNSMGIHNNPQSELIQSLLRQIIRVKELIKHYDSIPNGGGQPGSFVLSELVSEAYQSLVNYDTTLMKKYYDLLLTCD